MANKAGSDGQIRKTTAQWAADTDTYPEGMRLMDTTTGTVRVSTSTTPLTAVLDGNVLTSGSASTLRVRVARGGTSNTITILSATIIAHPI